jgi:hypothetical protein
MGVLFCRFSVVRKIGVDVMIVGGLLGRLVASSFSLLSQKAWPFVHDFGDATFSIRWPLEAPASKFVDGEEVMGGVVMLATAVEPLMRWSC